MRTLTTIAATLGVIGAIAVGSAVPAAAWYGYGYYPRYYGYHHRYYNYYGGGGFHTWNGCRPGWTVQGGLCKPYRYGPWDIYGGRQSDYGW
jgi:hypothetical protein